MNLLLTPLTLHAGSFAMDIDWKLIISSASLLASSISARCAYLNKKRNTHKDQLEKEAKEAAKTVLSFDFDCSCGSQNVDCSVTVHHRAGNQIVYPMAFCVSFPADGHNVSFCDPGTNKAVLRPASSMVLRADSAGLASKTVSLWRQSWEQFIANNIEPVIYLEYQNDIPYHLNSDEASSFLKMMVQKIKAKGL